MGLRPGPARGPVPAAVLLQPAGQELQLQVGMLGLWDEHTAVVVRLHFPE